MRALALIFSIYVASGRCEEAAQANASTISELNSTEPQKIDVLDAVSTEGLPIDAVPPKGRMIQCGRTYLVMKPRVIGGVTATFGQHPWQVALLSSTSPPRQFCSGALISDRHVLTAAHCLRWRRVQLTTARLGAFSFAVKVQGFAYEDFGIRRVIPHKGNKIARARKEGFVLQPNDLALLELERPVIFKKHIAPVCLPEKGVKYGGEMATIARWGKLDTGEEDIPLLYQKVDIKVIENEECQTFIAANYTPIQLVPDTQLCTNFESINFACEAYDGAPLVTFRDDQAHVIGISSWTLGCGGLSGPTGYTNVTNFVDWITTHLENSTRSDA